MLITYTGTNPLFLEQSFFDLDGNLRVAVTSFSPNEVVLTHTVFTQANVNVTLNGTGFATNGSGALTAGQITSIEFDGVGIEQATVTDINWSAATFQNALFDLEEPAQFSRLASLFNSSGPITIDATRGQSPFDQEFTWRGFLPLLTQPITFIGSQFDDSVEGTSGSDVIDTRGSTENADRIVGSEGDDIILFSLPDGATSVGYIIDYDPIAEPVEFNINGSTNSGTVAGPGFADTLQGVSIALDAYLGLEGTSGADVYNITLAPGQVAAAIGGPGADVYNIAADGGLPIFDFQFNDVVAGASVNLATGAVLNDGFGFSETINLSGTPDFTILRTTDLGDLVTDGPGDHLIRLFEGNDTVFGSLSGEDSIAGGGGTDLVAFDEASQGNLTIFFEDAVSTVIDRSAPTGSMALLGVEQIETNGGVRFEVSKHDGISTISAEDLTALAELYIAYFNRAADALGLSFWATVFEKDGFSLRDIADLFFTQPETVALYSDVSDSDFVQAVYNNVFGRDADQAGLTFWSAQLAAGNVTESGFIVDFLAGARAATGSSADVAYIENKTDIGLYFAVVQGQSNVTAARNVMDAFDGSLASIDEAINLADTALASAEASDTELLLPVIGVIASPFDLV
ncbi:DUF4214 domain-containing protein [Marivita hallyeonensis]|uniref:DUF4214 domain-containing protein n=1 Tax=Marivita hallyeonensis TaxID=996342 RepID=A0A1M5M1C7_9RHOB|nr:DUF4214 domain-containing protein [Marivita hallyeonensis]SHG71068.1 protein of unknown function [Marivita hallyeonensis]